MSSQLPEFQSPYLQFHEETQEKLLEAKRLKKEILLLM